VIVQDGIRRYRWLCSLKSMVVGGYNEDDVLLIVLFVQCRRPYRSSQAVAIPWSEGRDDDKKWNDANCFCWLWNDLLAAYASC